VGCSAEGEETAAKAFRLQRDHCELVEHHGRVWHLHPEQERRRKVRLGGSQKVCILLEEKENGCDRGDPETLLGHRRWRWAAGLSPAGHQRCDDFAGDFSPRWRELQKL